MESTSNSAPVAETSDSSRDLKLKKLADFLECCICHGDMRDARICGQCSQPFCRECIHEWLTKEQNCPHCRRALTKEGVIQVRTFDEMGDVLDELLADEKQNRCRSHNREQLFFCFLCEESICDRCAFEEVHLEHRDKVVLLDEAFNHFNRNTSEDFEWLKSQEHTLKMHEVRIQKNKNLLMVEFERVDAITRRTSESLSSQYAQKMDTQQNSQEIVKKRSEAISAMLEKSNKLETKKITASALEQLITFKKAVEELRSESSPTIGWVDLSFENNFIPSPVQVTFRISNWSPSREHDRCCESTANGIHNFVWKIKLARSNGCHSVSLLLEQGNPGAYLVMFRGNTTKLYEFELHKYVEMKVENINDIGSYYTHKEIVEVVVSIFQAQSYAERCQQQQEYIARLEKKIAEYKKVFSDFQENVEFLQSEDESETESNRGAPERTTP